MYLQIFSIFSLFKDNGTWLFFHSSSLKTRWFTGLELLTIVEKLIITQVGHVFIIFNKSHLLLRLYSRIMMYLLNYPIIQFNFFHPSISFFSAFFSMFQPSMAADGALYCGFGPMRKHHWITSPNINLYVSPSPYFLLRWLPLETLPLATWRPWRTRRSHGSPCPR